MYDNIIKLAMKEAKKSTLYPKIGAVVFKGKRIFGSGHNEVRSSSISNKYKRWYESLHAEQAALLNLDWEKIRGCSILVFRMSKYGEVGMCRPCPMCQKILKHVGIKKIYYTNYNGEIVLEKNEC